MKIKKYKKSVSFLLILFTVSLNFVPFFAQAATVLSPMDTINDIINYSSNINSQAAQPTDEDLRLQAMFNRKIKGPTVSLIFDPQNISSGQRISAQANPSGFSKPNDKLYFTWYLQRAGCGWDEDKQEDDNPDSDKKAKCDADKDGKITTNDWKVEAARIIAKGGFSNSGVNYNTTKDEKSDGFEAFFGNDLANGNDNESYCYFQDYTTGRTFELNKIKQYFVCPSGQHQQCVEDVSPEISSCMEDNPAYDPVTPVPGIPQYIPDNTPYDTKRACKATTTNSSADVLNNPSCIFEKDSDIDIYKLTSKCDANGYKAVCIPDGGAMPVYTAGGSTQGYFFSKTLPDFLQTTTDNSVCNLIGKDNRGVACSTLFNTVSSTAQAALDDKSGQTTDPNKDVIAQCNYKKVKGLCKHLFAEMSSDANEDDYETGDGKFTLEEEKFWGTDPADSKTAKNQNVDEANVVGLGVDKFTWDYRTGDKVGVAVEGMFTETTVHSDGSNMVMWALPNNVCKAFDDLEDSKKGFYTDPTITNHVSKDKVLAVEFDVNKCLPDNLVDPSGSNSLQVDIVHTPTENIINDPDGGIFSRGSTLTFQANVTGLPQGVSMGSLYYKWKFDVLSNENNPVPPVDSDPWISVTEKVNELNPSIVLEGNGLQKIDLPLNLPMDVFANQNSAYQYIRARVEISSRESGLSGKNSSIIKLGQLDDSRDIKVFPVEVLADGKLKVMDDSPSDELCNDAKGKFLCSVTKNEIIAVKASKTKLSGYQWKLNGNQMTCPVGMSDECSGGDIAFFPIVDTDDGTTTFSVNLNAIDVSSGSQVSVDRYFDIVEPSTRIESADYNNLSPRLFGFYKDINGNPSVPDYSTTTFEAKPGVPIKLKAGVYPSWKIKSAEFHWVVNGTEVENPPQQKELTIEPTGEKEFFVNLNVSYAPGSAQQAYAVRKALFKYWEITPEESYEQTDDANIQIIVLDSQGTENGNDSGFAANLASHIPAQILFLVRITITVFVFMFVVSLLFALMPESYATEEKRY